MFERAVDLLQLVLAHDGGRAQALSDADALIRVEPWPGSLPSGALTSQQLIDRITATELLVDTLQAEQARDIAQLVAARVAEDSHLPGVDDRLLGRTVPTELGLALRVAPMTAQNRMVTSVAAVEDHPALLQMVHAGRTSMAGLRRVVRQTDVLDPHQRRQVDELLAADVADNRLTPGMLEKAAIRRTMAADPDAAASRAARARADRRISLLDPVDGTAVVFTRLRAEESLAIVTTLEHRARGARAAGDERSLADLMCDDLIESVTGLRVGAWQCPPTVESPFDAEPTESPDPLPWDLAVPEPYAGQRFTTGPPPDTPDRVPRSARLPRRLPAKVELQIVISAATLLGLDSEPALLRGYGAIPSDVATEIADRAEGTVLRRLFCDPADGRLVAMDAATRCYTGSLRKFVLWRDQGCRLTGGRAVDIDHIEDSQDGGTTSGHNGESLSRNSHVVKHHPAVTVATSSPELVGDGLDLLRANAPTLTWTMPTRHSYRLDAPPALGWGSAPKGESAPTPGQSAQSSARLPARPQRVSSRRELARVLRQERSRRERRERRSAERQARDYEALCRDDDRARRRELRAARSRHRRGDQIAA